MERKLYINLVVDTLASAYTLGDGARSVLQKAIFHLYHNDNESPRVSDLITAIEQQHLKGRAANWKISATRALESLEFANISSEDQTNQRDTMEALSKSHTIIELNGLNQGAKRFSFQCFASGYTT